MIRNTKLDQKLDGLITNVRQAADVVSITPPIHGKEVTVYTGIKRPSKAHGLDTFLQDGVHVHSLGTQAKLLVKEGRVLDRMGFAANPHYYRDRLMLNPDGTYEVDEDGYIKEKGARAILQDALHVLGADTVSDAIGLGKQKPGEHMTTDEVMLGGGGVNPYQQPETTEELTDGAGDVAPVNPTETAAAVINTPDGSVVVDETGTVTDTPWGELVVDQTEELVETPEGETVVDSTVAESPSGEVVGEAVSMPIMTEVSSDQKTTEMFSIKKELDYRNFDVLLQEAVSLCQAANDDDADFEEGQYIMRRDVFGKRLKHFVLFSQKEGELSITFAGMDEVVEDTINEAEGNMVSHYSNLKALLQNPNTKMGFHAACLRALNTAYPVIRAELDKFSGEYLNFNIYGASSGGSMATIFYWLYVHDDVRPQIKMEVKECITIGAPRTVVDDFHNEDDYNEKCPNLLRIWNTMDVETYRPFKNDVIDNVMEVPSKFVHVGKPFCVDSNYETQNANLLVVAQLQPSTKLIASLLKKFDFDEQLALSDIIMGSGWQSLMAQCCVHALGRVEPIPEMPMLAFSELCGEWMMDMIEAPSLASRVSYLEGFGFEQLSQSTYLKELDGTSQSFALAALSLMTMAAVRRQTVMGTVAGYGAYIDSLIIREVQERKPITDRVDAKPVKQMGDWREYGVPLVPAQA